jgi:hypothetical protein
MTDPAFSVTRKMLQVDPNIHLVPDFVDEPDIGKAIELFIEDNYENIFLNELSAWYQDESLFPELSYPLFLQWFSFSRHSMIFDMLEENIEKDEMEE